MMESTEKLTDTNAILAYLYETFPLCFKAEGETKPLKIGLFQDLAERLADGSKISKTQLRVALRRYTSSWRYLKCIKPGVQRVDLEGNPCGELEQEHIEHAQATLKASQEKAKAKRQAARAQQKNTETKETKKVTTKKPTFRKPKVKQPEKVQRKPKVIEHLSPVQIGDLKANQRVNVKLGMTPVKGVVVDINKGDIQVQLDTGLTVKVRTEHILV